MFWRLSYSVNLKSFASSGTIFSYPLRCCYQESCFSCLVKKSIPDLIFISLPGLEISALSMKTIPILFVSFVKIIVWFYRISLIFTTDFGKSKTWFIFIIHLIITIFIWYDFERFVNNDLHWFYKKIDMKVLVGLNMNSFTVKKEIYYSVATQT